MRVSSLAAGALWLTIQVLTPAAASDRESHAAQSRAERVDWENVLTQPSEWYGSAEARRIAGNVLLYQRRTGGWPKNIDMTTPLTAADRARLEADKPQLDSTIDNGATWRQMRFLARVFGATHDEPLRLSVVAGLDYLFAAEYPTGGWPQFYPLRRDYSRHITFNDGASVNVAALLRDIGGDRAFAFVDAGRRARASQSVERTVRMIVAAQIRVDGRLTAWCAQHDAATLEPRPARSYEPVSLSGKESVEILAFLMSLPDPDPAVVSAIDQGVDWLQRVRIEGRRVTRVPAPGKKPDYDLTVIADPEAPPLWARFYEIGTNRPLFLGRDGIAKYELAAIEHERRTGYSWLGPYASSLLRKDYPAWRHRLEPQNLGT